MGSGSVFKSATLLPTTEFTFRLSEVVYFWYLAGCYLRTTPRFWKTWSVTFFCQQWTIIPFASGEIPLRQRQLKLQNSCGSGWERTEWDGPSIIEKQNLIGAWRAQHSFLAHPQPPAMIRISRAYNFAGFWEPPVQRCICWLVQCIQEQVQVLCMHAPGQNVQRYICWLVVVCKMRLSAARSGSFENRQLYQWVAGISFSSIVPLNWN